MEYERKDENAVKPVVLVLCATGKVGANVCYALQEAGYMVYGTTRGNAGKLAARGIIPILANYTSPDDVAMALRVSGAKRVFFITDFFGAAKSSVQTEIKHGKAIIDICNIYGCEHVIYSSAADADKMNPILVRHMAAKPFIEHYLFQSGLKGTVIRPAAFFENLDDPANWNPFKPGRVKFLTDAPVRFISTYDVGRLAAKIFSEPDVWANRIVEAASWLGTVHDLAKALETVSKTTTKGCMAMPRWLRRLFLNDLHHMCLYFELGYKGSDVDIDAFHKWVPNAFGPEDWFRYHAYYANGKPIVKDDDYVPMV